MAANLVTLCCSTEHLGRTKRLSSAPADLAGILHASSILGTTHSNFYSSSLCTSARNLVVDLWAACVWKCGGDAQPSVRRLWGAAMPHG